jgi:CspA family cold shock protein
MQQGVVKLWKGQYGFIQPDDGGPDVFVHVRAVERLGYEALSYGQRVKFEIAVNPRNGRDHAVDLQLVPPVTSPLSALRVNDDYETAVSHMQLSQQVFMKR